MVNRYRQNTFQKLSYQLAPGRCILCEGASQRHLDLCQSCEIELPWLGSHCSCCALPLPEYKQAALCGNCLQRPPNFHKCFCALRYDFPVDRLIAGFKHRRKLTFGAVLCNLWLKQCHSQLDTKPDALVPVPIHWRRRLARGFNQSLFIANELGADLNIPIYHAIQHPKATHSQQGLNAAERRKNLRQAFTFSKAYNIKGKHLAVIDDVVTTTATANTVAAILARNGAARVDIWCLARTP